jgi:hypothetical protein
VLSFHSLGRYRKRSGSGFVAGAARRVAPVREADQWKG